MRNISTILLILLPTLLSLHINGEKAAVFPELMKPSRIIMSGTHMYVIEGSIVFVYSRKDYSKIGKFGSKGEGPMEFLPPVHIIPRKEELMVTSRGKISYYTPDGEFLREIKNNSTGNYFFPLKMGYAGFVNKMEGTDRYFTVNIYSENLTPLKDVYSEKIQLKKPGKIELFRRSFMHKTYMNRIFITGKKGFVMDCLDSNGNLLYTIHREGFKRHKITAEDIKNANKYFKLRYGDAFEQFKHQVVYPEYFPEIRDFKVDDDRIYILPYEWNETGLKFYIYSTKGKFLSEQYIPLKLKYSMQPYPFVIKDDRVFQLVENEETEAWELHINKLNI